jgi:hypothetical protein
MPIVHREPTRLAQDMLYGLKERNDTPGPGEYTPTTCRTRGPCFSRSPRLRSPFPGSFERSPGYKYDQDSRLVHRSILSGSFARSARLRPPNRAYIACNTQTVPSNLSKRAHSFGASRIAYKGLFFPCYEKERLGLATRRVSSGRSLVRAGMSGRSFTRSPRFPDPFRSRFHSLGPGCYDPRLPMGSLGYAVPFGSPRGRSSRLDFSDIKLLSKAYWLM